MVLVVRDSGIGMPADQLDGIFEMFAQVDDDSERPRRGLGIGLTLVRRLVQLHGGTVTARSEGRGLGSEFEVRLPVLESHPEPDESQPLEAPEAGVRRVLVVDDNRDSADSIATLLQMSDHKTFIVHDGWPLSKPPNGCALKSSCWTWVCQKSAESRPAGGSVARRGEKAS